MKVKPENYARELFSALKKQVDSKTIAEKLWYTVQKNGQYHQIGEILAKMDDIYAQENGYILAHVTSAQEISESDLNSIKSRLENRYQKTPLIKYSLNPRQIAGLKIKIEDTEINLTFKGKINKLKTLLGR